MSDGVREVLHDTSSRLDVSTEAAWDELRVRLDGNEPVVRPLVRSEFERLPKRALLISLVAAVSIVGLIAALAWRGSSPPKPRTVSPATVPTTQIPAHLPAAPDPNLDGLLPDRLAVAGQDGNWAGYVDRSVMGGQPNYPAYPNDPEAAVHAYKRELVPVTETEDPESKVVGYVLRGYGYLDLATYSSPTFDIEALVAQGDANEQQEQQRAKAAGLIK